MLLLTMWLTGAAMAHPNHGDERLYAPAVPPPQPEVVVPEGFAEVVADLLTRSDDAEKALEAKRIADLYTACDAMTLLAKGLPERAKAVSEERAAEASAAAPALEKAVAEMRKLATKGSFSEAGEALGAFRTALSPLEPPQSE